MNIHYNNMELKNLAKEQGLNSNEDGIKIIKNWINSNKIFFLMSLLNSDAMWNDLEKQLYNVGFNKKNINYLQFGIYEYLGWNNIE